MKRHEKSLYRSYCRPILYWYFWKARSAWDSQQCICNSKRIPKCTPSSPQRPKTHHWDSAEHKRTRDFVYLRRHPANRALTKGHRHHTKLNLTETFVWINYLNPRWCLRLGWSKFSKNSKQSSRSRENPKKQSTHICCMHRNLRSASTCPNDTPATDAA